ncbi:hypothetical protein PENSPDRAFT_667707 [Peniophora sp. CONT]|nr:hypothetical protein PENSPDRAFT_667707 [Peniophora sp. CONT]
MSSAWQVSDKLYILHHSESHEAIAPSTLMDTPLYPSRHISRARRPSNAPITHGNAPGGGLYHATRPRTDAELTREAIIRSDPLADVQSSLWVRCLGCCRRIKLSSKSYFDLAHWKSHRKRCQRSGSVMEGPVPVGYIPSSGNRERQYGGEHDSEGGSRNGDGRDTSTQGRLTPSATQSSLDAATVLDSLSTPSDIHTCIIFNTAPEHELSVMREQHTSSVPEQLRQHRAYPVYATVPTSFPSGETSTNSRLPISNARDEE